MQKTHAGILEHGRPHSAKAEAMQCFRNAYRHTQAFWERPWSMGQGEKALTLIELLIVISIISLLAAMLLPVLKQALNSARQAACASQLKQIGLNFYFYADNNNGVVIRSGWGLNTPGTQSWHNGEWVPLYLRSANYEWQLLIDPAARWPVRHPHGWELYTAGTDYLDGKPICRANKICLFASYGLNFFLDLNGGWPNWDHSPRYFSRFPQPSRLILVGDSDGGCLEENRVGLPHNYRIGYNASSFMDPGPLGTGTPIRHMEGGNMAFADGHVEYGKANKWWGDQNQNLFRRYK